MLGAMAGDIIGSVYEFNNIKTEDFPLFKKSSTFTDDSVLTAAVYDSIRSGISFREKLIEYYWLYPNAGYGMRFHLWARSGGEKPYNSYGNGSAMRVSPVGWLYDDLDTVLKVAKESAEITHNHPEGIKGAQAAAGAVFLARSGATKKEIREFIEKDMRYNIDFTIDELRSYYTFNESCQSTIPQAIYTFLESTSFENSIRLAISIGGDSDTVACINGSIAEAFYKGVPQRIKNHVLALLDERLLNLVNDFSKRLNGVYNQR